MQQSARRIQDQAFRPQRPRRDRLPRPQSGGELDRQGRALSSPMAVAPAQGFALAASKQRVSLWLLTNGELVWLELEC